MADCLHATSHQFDALVLDGGGTKLIRSMWECLLGKKYYGKNIIWKRHLISAMEIVEIHDDGIWEVHK